MQRYGEHVLPVFETVETTPQRHASLLLSGAGATPGISFHYHNAAGHPRAEAMSLVEEYYPARMAPLYWRVHDNAYGSSAAWSGMAPALSGAPG